jgi:hypothetical protein
MSHHAHRTPSKSNVGNHAHAHDTQQRRPATQLERPSASHVGHSPLDIFEGTASPALGAVSGRGDTSSSMPSLEQERQKLELLLLHQQQAHEMLRDAAEKSALEKAFHEGLMAIIRNI